MNPTHIANPVSVTAVRILEVTDITDRSGNKGQSSPDLMLRLENGLNFEANMAMTSRYVPLAGDYVVTQEDGYVYLNPKDVFERKYAPIGSAPAGVAVTDEMVSRFLSWRLPEDFVPDGGVSFTRFAGPADMRHEFKPIGTNLFSAHQARAMLEHVFGSTPPAKMTFGDAFQMLKQGYRVAREGWNGKGMWLALSGPLEGRTISHDKFWSKHNARFAYDQPNSEANVLPCITMKTADGSILMGWLASQTDMLAEDWVVLP